MNPIEKAKSLIRSGLLPDNLKELIEICDRLTPDNPILWFTLKSIFNLLDSEFEDQAIPKSRHDQVNKLIPHFIKTIDDPSIDNINKAIIEFLR
jgi:hypothetical protein